MTVEDAHGRADWVVKVPESVRPFLSPDGIERLLAGRWDVVEDGTAAGLTTFDVAGARQRVRVTIDRATDLPVRLEASFAAALAWTLQEEAPLPLSGAPRSSGQGGSR